MEKGLVGYMYLQPDRLSLRIVDNDRHQLITQADSGSLHVGTNRIGNYPENIDTIESNLLGFKRIMKDYAVTNYRLFGSLIDMNSMTGEYVASQIKVRTGLHIDWINKNQRLAGLLSAINNNVKQSLHKPLTGYVLCLGLSISDLAYFKDGNYVTSYEIDLGKARLSQLADNLRQTTVTPSEIITDYISSKLEYLVPELGHGEASTLYVQGLSRLKTSQSKLDQVVEYDQNDFMHRYHHLLDSSLQEQAAEYQADEQSVQWVLPGYLILRQTMRLLNTNQLYLTGVDEINGLDEIVHDPEQLTRMVKTEADNLAVRYGADSDHKRFVTKVALQLFDALKPIHRLDDHYRLLLEIACKVDDIGNFINPQGHYRHSAYILEARPLIGLSDRENQVVAEVSRYHSAETPEVDQPHYMQLDSAIQLQVAQLAAILRVADSLDDSRLQKIIHVRLKLVGNDLQIRVITTDDLVLEGWAFQRKNRLFTEVYGLHPQLIVEGEK